MHQACLVHSVALGCSPMQFDPAASAQNRRTGELPGPGTFTRVRTKQAPHAGTVRHGNDMQNDIHFMVFITQLIPAPNLSAPHDHQPVRLAVACYK